MKRRQGALTCLIWRCMHAAIRFWSGTAFWHRAYTSFPQNSLRGGLIECEYRGSCCQGREHTHANYRCFQNCHSSPVEHITKLMASGSEIASGWSNAASIWPQPNLRAPDVVAFA